MPGFFWEEDWVRIERTWEQAGGRFYDGRLIAPKWDQVWARFGRLFPGGFATPFPPYARDSCATWTTVGAVEAVLLGATTKEEILAHSRGPNNDAAAKEVYDAFNSLSPEMQAGIREELAGFNEEQISEAKNRIAAKRRTRLT